MPTWPLSLKSDNQLGNLLFFDLLFFVSVTAHVVSTLLYPDAPRIGARRQESADYVNSCKISNKIFGVIAISWNRALNTKKPIFHHTHKEWSYGKTVGLLPSV